VLRWWLPIALDAAASATRLNLIHECLALGPGSTKAPTQAGGSGGYGCVGATRPILRGRRVASTYTLKSDEAAVLIYIKTAFAKPYPKV
jgi:hypothetical protein